MLAEGLERYFERVPDVFIDVAGNAYRPRFGETLHPCGDDDPVAIKIVTFDDHVAQTDSNAQDDSLVLGQIGVSLRELASPRRTLQTKFYALAAGESIDVECPGRFITGAT